MSILFATIFYLFNLSHSNCFRTFNCNKRLIIPIKSQIGTDTSLPNISLAHLKSLDQSKLPEFCDFVRNEFLKIIDKTGGHFSSNLGVVELTVCLHYVFDAPRDVIVWDIGHQSYIHKMLTGRLTHMDTVRQFGGLSGFCKRGESIYDVFGAGHSSTSISAIEGIALPNSMETTSTGGFNDDNTKNIEKKNDKCYIAIIGDGSLAAGMAYEAMGSIAQFNLPILLIYNDNKQTSLPTGTKCQGTGLSLLIDRKSNKFCVPPGWNYIGPIDGHNTSSLVNLFTTVKKEGITKPTILHVTTEKGRGYPPALKALDRMHSIKPNDLQSINSEYTDTNVTDNKSTKKTFTDVFAETLTLLAKEDEKIICVTAAMPGGTGVEKFAEKYPYRAIDVGIAEQHAVTLCAGMTIAGKRPFCCIYSTFLQRAMDQLIHDVFLQNLPVRFIVDRCGYVGEDGETHHGLYDLNIFTALPNGIIMSPSNPNDLAAMLSIAQNCDHHPSVIRLPRSQLIQSNVSKLLDKLPKTDLKLGKSNLIRLAADNRTKVSVLALGPIIHRVFDAILAIEQRNDNLSFDLVDMRFLRPLDINLLDSLIATRDIIVTVEEGPVGGFGSLVSNYVNKKSSKCKVRVG